MTLPFLSYFNLTLSVFFAFARALFPISVRADHDLGLVRLLDSL